MVKFIIDKNLDFKNHLIGANISRGIKDLPSDIVDYYKGLRDTNDKDKEKIFLKRTSKFYSEDTQEIRNMLEKQTQEMWDLIKDRFIERIEKIHDKSFPFKKISGVLTTAPSGIYGYDFNGTSPWFACSNDTPVKAMHTAMHEIMHAFFQKYFMKNYKDKFNLSDEKIWKIKEAVTVILNIEFNDLRMFKDRGHPGHEKLRENIEKNWLKYKNFNKVLDEVVVYL